jgi:lysophospholipase L1-like esterase
MIDRHWKIILILSLIGNLFIVYVAYKALDYRRHTNYFLDKYTNVVDDFSGRKTYQADNDRLKKLPVPPNRIVFIGSQITRGWDLRMHFPEFEAVNRGISGQRLAGYLLRFRSDVVDLRPKAVVIEFSSYNFRPENGINELEDFIMTLSDIARANGIVPILTTVVPVGPDFESEIEEPYNVQDSLNVYNRWLRPYCHDNNIPLVDFAEILGDSMGYLSKQNAAGQILLSPAGYEKISKATEMILGALPGIKE